MFSNLRLVSKMMLFARLPMMFDPPALPFLETKPAPTLRMIDKEDKEETSQKAKSESVTKSYESKKSRS